MRRSEIPLAAVVTLLASIAVSGCQGRLAIPQSPLLKYVERKSGLIAVTETDGNVYVMDQGGGSAVALTSDGRINAPGDTDTSGPFAYHQLPVWSPDGSHLASLYVSGKDQKVEKISIVVLPAATGEAVTVFSSTNQAPSLLGWSPDSTRLVFLATSPSGSSYGFYLVRATGGEPLLLDAGVPYGWAWSPRGQELVIHAGSVAGGLASDRLAFLDVENGVLEEGLGLIAGIFDTPAWSHDGRRVLVASWVDGKNRLLVTDRKRSESAVLSTVEGPLAFAFAPGGERAAYIVGANEGEATTSRLYVVGVPARLEAEKEAPLAPGSASAPSAPSTPAGKLLSGEDVVAAFFWSPDGSRIAYFVPHLVTLQPPQNQAGGAASGADQSKTDAAPAQPQQAVALTLKVADTRKGQSREVSTFLPTPSFMSVIQNFAQFGQSLQIWSPDSRNIVYAGLDQQGPAIMVALAAESIAPRRIAGGLDASWSRK